MRGGIQEYTEGLGGSGARGQRRGGGVQQEDPVQARASHGWPRCLEGADIRRGLTQRGVKRTPYVPEVGETARVWVYLWHLSRRKRCKIRHLSYKNAGGNTYGKAHPMRICS